MDGRYTIQAKMESGKEFKIISYEKILNCKIFKNLTIGIDTNLFTSQQIDKFFSKHNRIKELKFNLIDFICYKQKINHKPFFF